MEYFSRRQFLERSSLIVAPAILLPRSTFAFFDRTVDYQVVETAYGKLRGARENGVNIFKGVPYAGSVSGKNRFLKAGSVTPWKGVKDALLLGHPSIQSPNQTYGINEPEPAEDCLVLNIWTPANDDKKRPVMVYNHGGGYVAGSGGSAFQDGANLARMYDVVVVATNHRLGLLGYLYLDDIASEEYKGSGNRGVQDISVALKWIHENILEFGGDPYNIMIFGESGGGMKTSCLYAMPEAAPYFNKASIESGPAAELIMKEDAAQTTKLVLEYLNISTANWKKLLEVPASKLLEAQEKISLLSKEPLGGFKGIGNSGVGNFGAVVDEQIVPEHPFEPSAPVISKNKPLLVGWNEDEYIFFAMIGADKEVFTITEEQLKARLERDFGGKADLIKKVYHETNPGKTPGEIYIAIRSIMLMGLGSIEIAERKILQGGAPAYLYNFGFKSNGKIQGTDFEYGALHALDIQFKFYNLEGGMAGTRPDRYKASKNMCEFWTSFAKSGNPSTSGQPNWPAYNIEDRPTMRIDTSCGILYDRFKAEREMWESIM